MLTSRFPASRWSCPALPRGLHPLAVLSLLSTPQPELVVDERPLTSIEWLSTGGDPSIVADLVATPA